MAKGSEAGGCLNCYAARLSARNLPGMSSPTTGAPFARILQSGPRWTGKVELIEKALTLPLKWRKPKRIFVNSLSDLFHEALPDEAIDRVFAIMALCPQHAFQVLTKRPERMLSYLSAMDVDRYTRGKIYEQWQRPARFFPREFARLPLNQAGDMSWPLPNVWLGVSIENRSVLHRSDTLRETPAALRFLSIEPLLADIGELDLTAISWVIVGGESGPGARPMDIAWVRSVIRQCREAGVACFVKQLGAKPGQERDTKGDWHPWLLTDRKGGEMAEWPEDLRVREFPV